MFNTSFDKGTSMNLMLTATCDNTDAFYQSYLSMKPEFADCAISPVVHLGKSMTPTWWSCSLM